MITFMIGVIGVLGFIVLSSRRPTIGELELDRTSSSDNPKDIGISIVIPARNEENNLPLLLESISKQSVKPYEVIVVDDDSDDNTRRVAQSYDVRVIEAGKAPENVRPKVNALHVGFMHSSGDVVTFLDADTVLEKRFIENVIRIFSTRKLDCLSLQPYHQCKNFTDLMSMIFHVVSLVGSGLLSLVSFRLGLFGPCISMTRKCYMKSFGFNNVDVRGSLVEDVALEKVLTREGFAIARFMGTRMISYRMYASLAELFQGWKKNISIGASSAPIAVLVVLIAFIGFLVSAPIEIATGASWYTLGVVFLYVVALLFLLGCARFIGNYAFAVVMYPLAIAMFFVVFISSLFSLVARRSVSWKGRKLKA